jgi:hypothetical protein
MKRPVALLLFAAFALPVTAAPQNGAATGASVTFFAGDDFKGRGVPIDRPVISFRALGLDGRISSIAIHRGRWLVCDGDDFHGRCQVLDNSVARLGRIGLDRRISSARPLEGGAGGSSSTRGPTPVPGGSWGQSCRAAQLSGDILRAECNNGDRAWTPTQLNLRQCPTHRAGNFFGRLVCE